MTNILHAHKDATQYRDGGGDGGEITNKRIQYSEGDNCHKYLDSYVCVCLFHLRSVIANNACNLVWYQQLVQPNRHTAFELFRT